MYGYGGFVGTQAFPSRNGVGQVSRVNVEGMPVPKALEELETKLNQLLDALQASGALPSVSTPTKPLSSQGTSLADQVGVWDAADKRERLSLEARLLLTRQHLGGSLPGELPTLDDPPVNQAVTTSVDGRLYIVETHLTDVTDPGVLALETAVGVDTDETEGTLWGEVFLIKARLDIVEDWIVAHG